MISIFHYTDKPGWNSIRSQQTWRFMACQPMHPDRPPGAYFTDIEPSEQNLRTLHKRLRLPRLKQDFVFHFSDSIGLIQLHGGLGRDKRIYFSPIDYDVSRERQRYAGRTDAWTGG